MKSGIICLLSSLLLATSCIGEKIEGGDVNVGDSLPEFTVTMNDGSVITEDSLFGEVSFLMFFHTKCPDCSNTLPAVQKIYDEYIEKGVRFALISREESEVDIDDYWTEYGYSMPFSPQNDRSIYNLFASERIPRVYISDKDGIVRYIYTDDPIPTYDDLQSAIESLIR